MNRFSSLGVAAALLTQVSFGLTRPERSFALVKTEVESQILDQVADLVPISKQAHFITAYELHLSQGKFDPGRFSDFLGSAQITAKLAGQYHQFDCDINVNVRRDVFRKRDAAVETILEQAGTDEQLIGRFQVSCH